MAFFRRLEKLRRSLRWRLRRGVPLWWHVGRPNFGDDINPSLFQRLSTTPIRLHVDRRRPHLLGAGSILAKATTSSVVCGSGFLAPPGRGLPSPARVIAVRGERSLASLGCRADVALGDPVVLVDAMIGQVTKKHRFGLVPHVLSVPHWKAKATGDVHVIDPAHDPWRVVQEIAACDVIFSQSLHGLIVADALGVPNVWIAPSDRMVGGRFKFDDYFSTLDQPKVCVPLRPELFSAPGVFAPSVGTYRHSKDVLRASLAAACQSLRR